MSDKFLDGAYIAHRGLHNDEFPENTMGAFINAIEHGFAFEFDVRITKDNVLGILHDPDLERLCGVKRDFSEIHSNELDNYKILGTNYTIPSLKSVLDENAGKVPMLIEVKCVFEYKRVAKIFYETIKNYTGEYAVQSNNPLFLRYLHKLMPQVTLVYLCSKTWEGDKSFPKFMRELIYSLVLYNYSKATYISCQYDEVNKKVLKKSKGNLLLWTIRNSEQAISTKNVCKGLIFENFVPNK